MTQHSYFRCPNCERLHQEMRGVVTETGGGGEWLCPNCEHRYGVWSNDGALDLGIIRDSTLQGVSIDFEYVGEPDRCWIRRPHTNAHCEKPPGHDDEHGGRDSAGRWHFWE